MAALLSPVITAYQVALQPIPPFTWVGSAVSTFDVVAAFRLCFALRQMRESSLLRYQQSERSRKVLDADGTLLRGKEVEEDSLVKNIAIVLVTVYGGEAIMCPWLGVSPSFVFSPVVPGLYAALTALVDRLPAHVVPSPSLKTEFPLSFLDGLTRAFLVCQLIPPVVTKHAVPTIASSPWTLLLSSLFIANGGFFFVNLFSMLQPTGFSLATPSELRALGWTTVDLWCAPVTTGIYALLTHAQPFWADLHALLVAFLSPYVAGVLESPINGTTKEAIETKPATGFAAEALDAETARACCAVFLACLFVTRTVRNIGGAYLREIRGADRKKVMRSRIDGRRYPTTPKTKTQ